MKFTTKPATSPARARLTDMLKAQEAARAKLADINSRAARLEALARQTSPAQGELAALDTAAAAALAEWSANPEGDPPSVDTERRARLVSEVEAARSSASSATNAAMSLAPERNRLNAELSAITKALPAATSDIVIEETLATIRADAGPAIRAMEGVRLAGRALRVFAIQSQAAGALAANEIEFVLGGIKAAFDAPAPAEDTEFEAQNRLASFAVRLGADANARLES